MKSISIKMLKIMLLLIVGICLFSVVSKVSAMYISGPTILEKGKTYTFTAYDDEQNKVSCGWSSSKSAIATAINGRVTAKKEGTTVIKAESITGDEEAAITVTVIDSGVNDETEIESDSGEIDIAGTINVVANLTTMIIEIIRSLLAVIIPLLAGMAM